MKSKLFQLLLLSFLLGTGQLTKASNLIIFTESGDIFTMYVDGVQAGYRAANNVKIVDIPSGVHQLRFVWPNPRYSAYEMSLELSPGTEVTYALTWDSRRTYSLQFVSEVNLNYYAEMPSPQTVLTWRNGSFVNTGPGTNNNHNHNHNHNPNHNPTSDIIIPPGQVTTTTTTVIVDPVPVGEPVVIPDPTPLPPNPLPGYNGRIGCDGALVSNDMGDIVASLQKQSFENTKLTVAKQIIRSRCLLTSQVVQLLGEFSFESNKLDLAKYAYSYTYDIDNYYKVSDVFTFSSSIDELAKYIDGRR